MRSYGLVQAILLGRGDAGLVTWFALLAFCGLLRHLSPMVRLNPRRRARAENGAKPTIKLHAIELGLLAELSLEQARAHQELVDDPAAPPERRQTAAATAVAWRERARVFQAQAQRQGAAPFVPGVQTYSGPERRRALRRREPRRTGAAVSDGTQQGDRRRMSDRRRGDRRGPELASR